VNRRRSLLFAAVAMAAVPLFLLVDAATAYYRGWRVESRLDALGLLAAVCCLLITGVCLLIPCGRRRLASRGPHLLLFMTTGVVAWLLAEAVVGISLRRPPRFHTRRPNLTVVSRARPEELPGIVGESRYTTNSRAVRGPEFPAVRGTYRILCVGGSTTECFYLDDSESWPHLLMNRLNAEPRMQCTWVGDVGMPAMATWDHLTFIRQSPLMKEIDCVVALTGVNDLHWFLQGGPPQKHPGPWWSRSPILAHLRASLHRWPEICVEDSDGAVYEERRQRRRNMTVIDALPDMEPALREYAGRIHEMARLCREKNVRLLCVTQPVLWDAHLSPRSQSLLWMGWQQDQRCLTPAKLREGMERFNDTLRTVCQTLDLPCVDASSLSGGESLFYDDCHFNEQGAKELADLIAAWFLDHKAGDRWAAPHATNSQ